jgi:hypothetical protein
MSLTENLVWQMNTVFRCEYKIAEFYAEVRAIDDQQLQGDEIMERIRTHIDSLDTPEDPDPHRENLQVIQDAAAKLQDERLELMEKIEQAKEELGLPKEALYRDLKCVLSKHKLLEEISANDQEHVPWNAEVIAEASEGIADERTPSEIAHETLEHEQYHARDTKGRMEAQLRFARTD